ncbi:MAG: YcfA-like protein [Candidatus Methanofastidiosum methylothiophilum]|uniref:YcfA-like protein n=1 Tax=Candidatus Methanofastidiosum methylothiophilum TaxID=1705564 RepID=A0A150IP60_9EURY|nr:MAG: YcfA-like protein [Candidatus Methanofastidiosum methylthiophilus]
MNSSVLSGLEVIKILKRAGFIAVRQKGSHVRLEKVGDDGIIKITVPLHDELKKGTLMRIIKDSGLTQEEFERYR